MNRYGWAGALFGGILGAVGAFALIMHQFSLTNPNYATDGIGVNFAVFFCAPIGALLGARLGYGIGHGYDDNYSLEEKEDKWWRL